MSSVAEGSSLMKPVVVRVKRKLSQASLDAFWLEINERPLKRALLDFEKLSVSESTENGCLKTKKVLVQHVETVSSSEATKDVLRSLMAYSSNMDFKKKIEERRHIFKQENQKQDQLRSLNRQKHEEFVRSARFEQIWKSRNRIKEKVPDHFIHEFCHLYDVVRVDEETSNSLQENKNVCVDEDDTILCNYLALLRECLPDAAAEIEDMHAYSSDQARYVYDLYTEGDDMDVTDENDSAMYPLVQVENEDDYYDGLDESEYETDDSNAEDNPRNDYPDEESSEESGSRSSNSQSKESSEDEDFIYGAKGSEDEGFIYEAESSEDDDSTYEELDEDREETEDYRMLAQC